jgi:hypothetical protein
MERRNDMFDRESAKIAIVSVAMIAVAAAAWAAEKKESSAPASHAGHDQHAAAQAMPHHESAEPTSFTGEVIDLTCFTAHPETGRGPEHAECATSCLEKGLPAGLLVGDRLYTAVMKDHSAPFKHLAAYAGQVIGVKGVAKQSHGSWFLLISSIEPPPAPGGAK